MFGQTKFEKGYFVDANDEIVNCFIKNERWLNSPKEIIYKISESSPELNADATKIKKFKVDNGPLYIAHSGNFPIYKNRVASQNANKEIKTIDRSVFLVQVLKGTATLYEFREGNDVSFAYKVSDNPIEILLYGESVDENNRIRSINTFRNQLYKDVKCGSSTNIQSLNYSKKPIVDFFRNFNSCVDPGNYSLDDELISKVKSKLSLKLWVGVQQFDFGLVTPNRTIQYDKTITPKIGLELENIFGFNNGKWSFLINTSYTSHKSEANYQLFSTNPLMGTAIFELSRLENLAAARHYMFINDKSSFFIETGFTFDFDFKTNIKSGTGSAIDGISSDNFKSINFAIAAGIGYSYNQKLYSRLNYYFNQNMLTFVASYENNLSRLAFTIGYKL